MSDRRALVEGLKGGNPTDRIKEKAFVFGEPQEPTTPPTSEPAAPVRQATGTSLAGAGRVPLTTRIRPDLAELLKRTSLQRQLDGVTPCSVQDIVEQALETWLAFSAQKP